MGPRKAVAPRQTRVFPETHGARRLTNLRALPTEVAQRARTWQQSPPHPLPYDPLLRRYAVHDRRQSVGTVGLIAMTCIAAARAFGAGAPEDAVAAAERQW